jgi:DeoR/GlpR family transcriptional regulator of sugar metabolism
VFVASKFEGGNVTIIAENDIRSGFLKSSSDRMMTRIKAMYFYIDRKGTVTTKELVEEFGTTQRTVQRDLHVLSYNGLVKSPTRGQWTTTKKKVKKTS